jgi:hypothetical protein
MFIRINGLYKLGLHGNKDDGAVAIDFELRIDRRFLNNI